MIFCWGVVLVWMALIFHGSGPVLSSNETSRFLRPLLLWLFPSASEPDLRALMTVIRKGGHVTEYAILAILSCAAVRVSRRVETARFWLDARWALVVAVLYAVSDEFHQSMVPSRQGAWQDVIIDSFGALAGLLMLWCAGRVFKKW